MLADFLREMVGHVRASDEAKVIEHPDLGSQFMVSQGGRFHLLEKSPRAREHFVEGLNDVLRFVCSEFLSPMPEVYHSADAIVLLLDGRDRRERVTLRLRETERFSALRQLGLTPARLSVRDAVRFLRYSLAGTNIEPVVQAVRRIDFSRAARATNVVEHGKESLGRSVEAAVQQADKVPEEFTVTVPVYANEGCRESVDVRLGLYLNVEAEAIELFTLPDQVQQAIDVAQARIATRLLETPRDGTLVVHGSPN